MTDTLNKKILKRILVVDDEPNVAETLNIVLVRAGHVVDLAEDAEGALLLFENGKYDLIITDFALGKVTGRDLAHTIKAKCPAQPIIMITAYAECLGQDKRPSPIDFVLGKPFSIEQLYAILAKVFAPA